MKLEREIKRHKAVVFQEGDVINSPFCLEVYAPGATAPEYRGQVSFPVAYGIWKKWGMKPADLLFEEAESYISDKSRLDKVREWAKTL
jgi:hypothetical protein